MNPLVILLGIGLVAVVAFWPQILNWAEQSLFPWMEKHMPTLLPYVRDAFVSVDNVIVQVRTAVKNAWQRIKTFLLKQAVDLNKNSNNQWVKKVTSWVIKVLQDKSTVPVKIEETQEVKWEELPPEVREEFLRQGNTTFNVNVKEVRDQELEMYQ